MQLQELLNGQIERILSRDQQDANDLQINWMLIMIFQQGEIIYMNQKTILPLRIWIEYKEWRKFKYLDFLYL